MKGNKIVVSAEALAALVGAVYFHNEETQGTSEHNPRPVMA
jgi:hypothetical protein